MNFKKSTLPNGLRVITAEVKDSPTVTVSVAVETGSNYESESENGISHFLEHMCFKGTTKRPGSRIVSHELDALGAENNAFTSNELTLYYAKVAKKHFHKAFEIVSDLYLNPLLPKEDLERERGVILEELSMYEDIPQYKVQEVLAKLVYGDTPAGRSILGPRENIKRFNRDDFVKYRNKHYVAPKTIVIVSGNVEHKDVLKKVKTYFKDIPVSKKVSKQKVIDKQSSPQILIHKKKTDQTHMVLACRAYKANDKRSLALILLVEVLGKGMSSRLFTKLREEMGACYYVKSSYDHYTDHGLFTISTGVNISRTKEVLKVLLEECNKLANTLVSEEELNKAKEHFAGHLYMGLETNDALAGFYVEQEVVTGELKKPVDIEKSIRNITAKDIQKVAKDIFKNNKLNLAVVGDIKNEAELKKILSF
ncbi:insulinase family protein [Candidatus Parcubacteria bacterium]|nr:insulinase family protein [Candidatus Parcubacteria bacterium]